MKDWGPAVLRIALGVVFVGHGLQKVRPIWGSSSTATFFESVSAPANFQLPFIVGCLEIVGGVALVLGAFVLPVALVLLIDVAMTAFRGPVRHGFFLNWRVEPGIEHGFEYHFVLAAALICLMLCGAGALSVDSWRVRLAESRALGRARLRTRKS